MSTYVTLSTAAISTMSPSFRSELADHLQAVLSGETPDAPAQAVQEDDGEPADLSLAMVRAFMDRCADKTKRALELVARAPLGGFMVADIAKDLTPDEEAPNLTPMWSGITKRTRTVLGDPEAGLFIWNKVGEDWHGRVSELTHRSLRRYFDL